MRPCLPWILVLGFWTSPGLAQTPASDIRGLETHIAALLDVLAGIREGITLAEASDLDLQAEVARLREALSERIEELNRLNRALAQLLGKPAP